MYSQKKHITFGPTSLATDKSGERSEIGGVLWCHSILTAIRLVIFIALPPYDCCTYGLRARLGGKRAPQF
jgi:hypothetical protein|tara:strand:+ start:11975 stop:12184 length:210 start_codon:yes stop_codon:yes gene_type:complete